MGYFDYASNMDDLEYEFLKNRNVGRKNLLKLNVPLAEKIIKMKKNTKMS